MVDSSFLNGFRFVNDCDLTIAHWIQVATNLSFFWGMDHPLEATVFETIHGRLPRWRLHGHPANLVQSLHWDLRANEEIRTPSAADIGWKNQGLERCGWKMARLGKVDEGNHHCSDPHKLVGGWATPLKHMKVSWDHYSQYMEKNAMFQTTNQWLKGRSRIPCWA